MASPLARLMIKLGVDDSEVDETIRSTPGKFDKLGSRMSTLGQQATLGLTLPLVAAGAAGFKMASDLDESLSQVGQVFGDEAGNIVKASENMGDAFSQSEFLSFAGNLGDITQGIGIARSESDEWATSILDLSQDLGSFKNQDPSRVIEAITAAITGEREQLKSLGIVINEAMVKQKAMEMGLADANGEISQAAKAQATMALITEKSANALGDFDRTSEGAANKTRILSGNFKDAAASLAQKLLPIGSQLLTWANKAFTWFNKLSPTTQEWILKIAGVAAAIGPVLFIGGKLISAFGAVGKAFKVLSLLVSANPWVLIIAGTIALVTLIVTNWDTIVAVVKKAWDWIKRTAGSVYEAIRSAFKQAVDFVYNLFLNFTPLGLIVKHFDKIKEVATGVKDWIVDKFNAVVDFFTDLPGRISRAVSGMWNGLKNAFRNAVNWIIDKWNGFSLGINLPGIFGGGRIAIDTPNIPRLHDGGIFRAPTPGGEGLAILKDREVVSPAGGINVNVQTQADPFAIGAAVAWRLRTAGV